LAKLQPWVGLTNEIMNGNSWMVLKSTIVTKEMANEKLGVATEPSPENLGSLELCTGGAKPTKASPWQRTFVAKLQLAF